MHSCISNYLELRLCSLDILVCAVFFKSYDIDFTLNFISFKFLAPYLNLMVNTALPEDLGSV